MITAREREVLLLIGAGHSAKEIGRALGISGNTVESFAEKIRFRLRARNGAHSIILALQAGFITLDEVQA